MVSQVYFNKIKKYISFWKPWGPLGCLWRYLLFLGILTLLIMLLRGCKGPTHDNEIPVIADNGKTYNPPSTDSGKTKNSGDEDEENGNIPYSGDLNSPNDYLPKNGDNTIVPIEDDEIIDDEDGKQLSSNRLNVLLELTNGPETINEWSEKFKRIYPSDKYGVLFYDALTGLIQIKVPENDRLRIKSELQSEMPEFSFKVFDESLFNYQVTPNDPVFNQASNAWYFDAIQAREAWDVTMGDTSIVVAIVDSYVDITNEEFQPYSKIVKPFSVSKRNGDVMPRPGTYETVGHGTHVASIAVGNANNKRGTSGIAPNCKLMPVSIANERNQIEGLGVVEGILYAIYQGADVINVSLGVYYNEKLQQVPIGDQLVIADNSSLEEANVWDFISKIASQRNCVLVLACGNQNIIAGIDPSKRSDKTIRVSSTDKKDRRSRFSNFGNFGKDAEHCYSTISAPGEQILGALPLNQYTYWDGTSMASPIVSGAVALLKSLDRSLSTSDIINILQSTGKPLPAEDLAGPLIQIRSALDNVSGDFMKYDDILKDSTSIIGLWRSTETMTDQDGNPVWLYFNFFSNTDGRFIIRYVDGKGDFTAPLSVTINQKDGTIHFTQMDVAKNENSNIYFSVYKFDCKNVDNILFCRAVNTSNTENIVDFKLRKIR